MDAIRVLAQALGSMPDVRLAVLFGSSDRGTHGPGSDLDLGVSLESGSVDLSGLAVTLERALGHGVDLICLSRAPPLLRFEIARDGTVLVERHPGDWAGFRARAMIDWWDWAPTARRMQRANAARLQEEAARFST